MSGLSDVEIIGVLKTYVKKSLAGAGSLEGAPCQIQSIVDNNDGTQTVTFLWEDNDGDTHTTEMNTPSAIYDFALLQNGQIMYYDSTDGKWKNGNLPTIDSALSNSSENAVQNKVVNAALALKADSSSLGTAAAADSTSSVTENSTDLLTSGGAYTALADKVDKVSGKGLSANDFTNELKTKLDGIESGAEVNIIEAVKVNGSTLTPDANRAVDISAVTSVAVNGVSQTVTSGAVDLDVETNLITDTTWASIETILV